MSLTHEKHDHTYQPFWYKQAEIYFTRIEITFMNSYITIVMWWMLNEGKETKDLFSPFWDIRFLPLF